MKWSLKFLTGLLLAVLLLGTARSETAAYDGAAVYRFADLAEAEDICILEYRKGWFQKVYMGCEAGE